MWRYKLHETAGSVPDSDPLSTLDRRLELGHERVDRVLRPPRLPHGPTRPSQDSEGVPVLALCPTDQLFHAMVHGVFFNAVPPMRWVTDAFHVIRSGAEIDWDRWLATGQRLRVMLPLRDSLRYLVEKFGAPAPPAILDALRAWRPSRAERLSHERSVDPQRLQGPVDTCLAHWYPHASSHRDRNLIVRLLGLPTFLSFYWSSEGRSLGLLPGTLRWLRRRAFLRMSNMPE